MNDQNASPTITFDDFLKVDIRAGQIIAAERVPKSDKLLKLQVFFGPELGTRQVLAGIGATFPPEALVNNVAAFVVNLAPRKMMGLESHGMILAGDVPSSGPPMVEVPFLTCLLPGTRLG